MSAESPDMSNDLREKLAGLLLGTAVGDALGLPSEGLSPEKIRRRWHGPWQMRFVLGRGMISDDTEHTLIVAQALLEHPDDVIAFQRTLAWKLRWWLLCLPAGVGLATARACIKLWLGFPPTRSGVYSAGNGPAMRSAIIGAYFAAEPERMKEFVRASTIITHSDPKAFTGALAIAVLAGWSVSNSAVSKPNTPEILELLRAISNEPEWSKILDHISTAYEQQTPVEEFAKHYGAKGVSGYIFHTVPVAIYAWLKHFGDFESGLSAVLNCGGDTDTVGAIAGAMFGTTVGERGVPQNWISGICEYPRSPLLLRKVATRLATQKRDGAAQGGVAYPWPTLIPRNVAFLVIVLVHGFRRLLPPF